MPKVDFTDEELAAVSAALQKLIDDDRFPYSPRLKPLKAALAKLDSPKPPKPKAPPPPPIAGASEAAIRRQEATAARLGSCQRPAAAWARVRCSR